MYLLECYPYRNIVAIRFKNALKRLCSVNEMISKIISHSKSIWNVLAWNLSVVQCTRVYKTKDVKLKLN